MNAELEVIKIYQNDHKRSKYSIDDVSPMVKYKYKNNKFKAFVKINQNIVIKSNDKDSQELAKNDCFINMLEFFKIKDQEINDNKKISKNKSQIIYLLIMFLFILHIMFNINNVFTLISLPLIILVFGSPYFLREYDIGVCTGNRVIVRWTSTVENKYFRRVYYLNQGDLFLIKSKAEPNTNTNYFEAVITKQIILTSNNNNPHFPTYILPEQISCGISKTIKNGSTIYYIDLLTYEIDGEPKRYVNLDVPSTSFTRSEEVSKYHIISKYGEQVIKERFIGRAKNDSLNWYFGVLSIFADLIMTKINDVCIKSHREEDRRIGFDNFQPVKENLQVSN